MFDLDGTVVDSKPGILASCSAALRSLGHRPEGLDIGNLIGPPLEEVLAEILGRFGDDCVAEAALAYRDHYGPAGFLETTVYPGLAVALNQLLAAREARRDPLGSTPGTNALNVSTALSCRSSELFDTAMPVILEVRLNHSGTLRGRAKSAPSERRPSRLMADEIVLPTLRSVNRSRQGG